MMAIFSGHKAVNKPDGSTPDSWFPYTCGHCGRNASGYVLAYARWEGSNVIKARWLQCPTCREGSVETSDGSIIPGSSYGPTLEGLPGEVEAAYAEARRCLSVNADTAAELVCRKVLMHIAVDKGADEGKTFASYIDYHEQHGYVTPPMKPWVKLIKDNGNETTHRIKSPDRKRAEGTLQFTAQLLRTVYEMGHIASQFSPPPATAP